MQPKWYNRSTATQWSMRIVPITILGIIGFTIYVVVSHLDVDYLYRERQKHGVAIALLVVYAVFLVLTLVSYARTFHAAHLKPGYVPLSAIREEADRKRTEKGEPDDPEAQTRWYPPDNSPDSPGLEEYYVKEVFACEADGRPRWCSLCWHWKPDRAHHSSEMGRCVRKMDHLCPWVGGMVSEQSFNFFFQFTTYCTLYCAICLATSAYCLRLKLRQYGSIDGLAVAVIALAGFFGFFAIGMTLTSSRYIFQNMTNIDALRTSQVYTLAIRVPRETPSTSKYRTVTFPLPLPPDSPQEQQPPSERDAQATHTFAVVRGENNENPWDLGYWRNFKAVMGNNPLEWFLPLKHSPCCNHESMVSDYELGPLVEELRTRYGLPRVNMETNGGIELQEGVSSS